jgi:hypothetical protein
MSTTLPDALADWLDDFLACIAIVESSKIGDPAVSPVLVRLAALLQGPPRGHTAAEYHTLLRRLAQVDPRHGDVFTLLVLHGLLRNAERKVGAMIGLAVDAQTPPRPTTRLRSWWASVCRVFKN